MTLTLTAAEVQTLHTWLAQLEAPALDEQDRRYLAKRVERAAAGIAEPWGEQARLFLSHETHPWPETGFPKLTVTDLLGNVPREL